MHPKDYERFLAMKEEEKSQTYHDRNEYQAQHSSKFDQRDFDRIVMEFMINGMHHPNLLEDPSFSTLLNGNSNSFIFLHTQTFFDANNEIGILRKKNILKLSEYLNSQHFANIRVYILSTYFFAFQIKI